MHVQVGLNEKKKGGNKHWKAELIFVFVWFCLQQKRCMFGWFLLIFCLLLFFFFWGGDVT